jgi:hypothetical protein
VALQHPKGAVSKAAAGPSSAAKTSSAPSSRSTSRSTSRSVGSPPASSRTSPSASTSAPSGTGLKATPLVVLNNSTTTGLAKQAAQQFEAGGWSVTDTGNLTNDIVSTCAYYDPADGSALAAAEALQQQFPAIKRIKPKFAELPSGPIVVVLTSDFTLG